MKAGRSCVRPFCLQDTLSGLEMSAVMPAARQATLPGLLRVADFDSAQDGVEAVEDTVVVDGSDRAVV